MQKGFGFDVEKMELLLASSGQATYIIVEIFLIQHILYEKGNLVYCPYIYFENLEQIKTLNNIKFIVSDSAEVESLIQLIEENNAGALFIEPLTNVGTFHLADFWKF